MSNKAQLDPSASADATSVSKNDRKRKPNPRYSDIPEKKSVTQKGWAAPGKKARKKKEFVEGGRYLLHKDKWYRYKSKVSGLARAIAKDQHTIDSYEAKQGASKNAIVPKEEVNKCKDRIIANKKAILSLFDELESEHSDHHRWPQMKRGDDDDSGVNVEDIMCSLCNKPDEAGNDIVLCDRTGCLRAYHQNCLDPPLALDEGDEDATWFCRQCACIDDCFDLVDEVLGTNCSDYKELFSELRESTEVADTTVGEECLGAGEVDKMEDASGKKTKRRTPSVGAHNTTVQGAADVGKRVAVVRKGVLVEGLVIAFSPNSDRNDAPNKKRGKASSMNQLNQGSSSSSTDPSALDSTPSPSLENAVWTVKIEEDDSTCELGFEAFKRALQQHAEYKKKAKNPSIPINPVDEQGQLDAANVISTKRAHKPTDYASLHKEMFGEDPVRDSDSEDEEHAVHFTTSTGEPTAAMTAYANTANSISAEWSFEGESETPKRKRGRPLGTKDRVGPDGTTGSGKKRGRPMGCKDQGPRNRTGKPLGRPRKYQLSDHPDGIHYLLESGELGEDKMGLLSAIAGSSASKKRGRPRSSNGNADGEGGDAAPSRRRKRKTPAASTAAAAAAAAAAVTEGADSGSASVPVETASAAAVEVSAVEANADGGAETITTESPKKKSRAKSDPTSNPTGSVGVGRSQMEAAFEAADV